MRFFECWSQSFYQNQVKEEKKYLYFKYLGGLKKNIISLGCGYDTLYFNLITNPTYKNLNFTYVESDLPEVVINKVGSNFLLWFTWIFSFFQLKKISTSKELKNILNIEDINLKGLYFRNKIVMKKMVLEQRLEANNYILFAGDIRDPEELIKTLANFKIDFEFFKFFW